jgi:PKD repeat protein
MSGSKQNMEELFSSQFDGFETEPSAGMWSRIRMQLFRKEFFSFSVNTLNVYYTAAAAVVLIGGAVLVTSLADRPGSLVPQKENEIINQEMSPATEIEESIFDFEAEVEEMEADAGLTEADPDRNQPLEKSANTVTGSDKEQKNRVDKDGEVSASDAGATEQQILKTEKQIIVSAGFEASRYQGCAPLAVEFNNQSENAGSFLWSFGDGGSSGEEHPSYVFDEPGEYTVNLKVRGLDGKEYISTRKLEVYVTPKAQFEYDEDIALASGQPVNFYNYSKDAVYFAWDFGDDEQSALSDPVHYYDAAGEFDITLRVWTANQCFDSTTVLNAFALSENNIIFPNAFTPNMSGPAGGFYTLADPRNEVFHPIVMGEVLEYELKVYNRIGQEIFATTDINYGWDGYYKDQLSGQGVYIWKSRGRYINGKTFVKSGDITLIWK